MTFLRVRAGGLTFLGQPDQMPFEGFAIGPQGFEGWDDGTTMSRTVVDQEQAAGAYDADGLAGTRTLELSGSAVASSVGRLRLFGDQFRSLGAQGGSFPVTVDHLGVTRSGVARLDGKPTFEVQRGLLNAKFATKFWFANPRLVGHEYTFGPAVSVLAHHYGNFPAAPVITVAGVIGTSYTINGPNGAQFKVALPVTAGHPHTIDMATGLLYIDDAIFYGAIGPAQTWEIPPGAAVSQTLVPFSGAGTLTVVVKDTYI